MNKKLQITLYVIAVYLTILGILFLFLPGTAGKVMSASLPDAALTMLYGQLTLTFAYLAFLAARGGDDVSILSRLVLVLTAGHVLIFGYQLGTGMMNFAQAGPPLIVNAVFTTLLFFFRKDEKG